MIKNIFTHWRTSVAGVTLLVTSAVSLGAAIINHNCTQALVTACILGILAGIAALASQDAAEGAKAHAESQEQIRQLQERSNIVPNAIESGDTSQLRRVPITPASVPVVPPVADPPKTP